MVEVFAGEKIAAGLLKVAAPLAGAAALVAAGFGLGVAYEHKMPWALGPQLTGLQASLPQRDRAQRDAGALAQVAADKPAFSAWSDRLSVCTEARQDDARTAAAQIDAARHSTTVQASAAYQMGRATCGATHATSPSAPGAAAAVGGVQDQPGSFRDLFSAGAAAAAGGGAVPGPGPSAARAAPALRVYSQAAL